MYLIKYSDESYINGELIEWVGVTADGNVKFEVDGELYRVYDKHRNTFLNHLQGLNTNISNVEELRTDV